MASTQTLFGSGTALSRGSDSQYNFYPLTEWLPAAGVTTVRAAVEIRGTTGSAWVTAAYQTSNDMNSVTQADGVAFDSEITTGNGMNNPTDWEDIGSATQAAQFVRFGVRVRNATSVTPIHGCWVGMRIDTRSI